MTIYWPSKEGYIERCLRLSKGFLPRKAVMASKDVEGYKLQDTRIIKVIGPDLTGDVMRLMNIF